MSRASHWLYRRDGQAESEAKKPWSPPWWRAAVQLINPLLPSYFRSDLAKLKTWSTPKINFSARVYGQELDTMALPAGRYCEDSKWCGEHKMAAPESWIFCLHFCTVTGRDNTLCMSFTIFHNIPAVRGMWNTASLSYTKCMTWFI